MTTPEQLINDLIKENNGLKEELEQARKDIEDFEKAALIWKKGYSDTEKDYKRKLGNAQKTIEQLEMEINEFLERQK